MSAGFVTYGPSAGLLARLGPAGMGELTDGERRRASAFRHDQARCDFLAAHLLVRECAAAVLDLPPSQVRLRQRCARCGGPHGRVELLHPGWQTSITHAGGHVAVAVAPGPVGVDLAETTGRASLPRSALTAAERALVERDDDPDRVFARLWARKEALVKVGHCALDDVCEVAVADASFAAGLDLLDEPTRSYRSTLFGLEVTEWTMSAHRSGLVGAAVSRTPLRLVPAESTPWIRTARPRECRAAG